MGCAALSTVSGPEAAGSPGRRWGVLGCGQSGWHLEVLWRPCPVQQGPPDGVQVMGRYGGRCSLLTDILVEFGLRQESRVTGPVGPVQLRQPRCPAPGECWPPLPSSHHPCPLGTPTWTEAADNWRSPTTVLSVLDPTRWVMPGDTVCGCGFLLILEHCTQTQGTKRLSPRPGEAAHRLVALQDVPGASPAGSRLADGPV